MESRVLHRACPYNPGSTFRAPIVSIHPLLNIAVRAARQAGDVIARNIDRADDFAATEKAPNDYVTVIDKAAERRIIDTIRRSHPDHAFLAEESGAQGRSDTEWIIDPLDGTVQTSCTGTRTSPCRSRCGAGDASNTRSSSILCARRLFTASRGSGARLDDRRIRVAGGVKLKGTLLGTGLPFRASDRRELHDTGIDTLASMTARIRQSGSAALDLAYVAAGRLDGFWELGLRPWDMAAGALLVQEAGGIVAEPNGGDDYLRSGNVVAANPTVLRHMLRAIRPAEQAPGHPAETNGG